MKISTILLIIAGVLAGAWVLSLIYHFSAWLSSLPTSSVITIAIVAGLIWLYVKFRNRGKENTDEKS
jgi:MFS superfamily sulfate permease-like transporter